MVTIAGKYEMTSTENFEEYLKAIGVNMALRKIGAMQKPTIEFTVDGDNYKMKTVTTFKTIDLAFKIDEEFVEDAADGRKCNTTITRDGNKLIHVQKLGDLSSRVTRTFTDDGMTVVFESGNVVARRSFKRIA